MPPPPCFFKTCALPKVEKTFLFAEEPAYFSFNAFKLLIPNAFAAPGTNTYSSFVSAVSWVSGSNPLIVNPVFWDTFPPLSEIES